MKFLNFKLISKQYITLFILFEFILKLNCQSKCVHPSIIYDSHSGLATNVVYSIIKDSKGLIWICTNNGLIKFNGITFTTYNRDDGLPDNEIFRAVEDNQGRIWLSSFEGYLTYYKNGLFHKFNHPKIYKTWDNYQMVNDIIKSKDGEIIIYQKNKSIFYVINDDKVDTFSIDHNTSKKFIFNITYFNNTEIEVSWQEKPGTCCNVTYYKNKLNEYKMRNKSICCKFNENVENNPYAVNQNRIKINIYKQKVDINSIKLLHNYDNTFSFINTKGKFNLSLTNKICSEINNPSSLLINNDNEIWVSSLTEGIYVYHNFKHLVKEEEAPPYATIDLDKIKILTNHQCTKIINKKSKVNISLSNITNIEYAGLVNNYIYLYADSKLYVSKKKYTNLRGNSFELLSNEFAKQIIVSEGAVIIDHLNKISSISIPSKNKSILYESTSRINGLVEFNGKIYILFKNKFYVLSNDEIKEIDSSLTYAKIATLENYLFVIDKNNYLFYKDTSESKFHKLTNYGYDSMKKIDNKTLLIKRNESYLISRKEEENLKIYFIENINFGSKIHNIEIIEDTVKIKIFDKNYCYPLKQFKIKNEHPKLVLNYFENSDNLKFKVSDKISLGSNSYLKVTFDVIVEENNLAKVYYKLNNATWKTSPSIHEIIIEPKLGKNILYLKCFDAFDRESEVELINFTVVKPIWRLALLPFILLLASLIFIFIFIKRTQENEEKLKLKIENLQKEFKYLNAIMNPHFIFNCMNSISYFVAKKENAKAEKYINVLAKLIRQNMENIQEDFIPINRELELITHYFELEKMRFKSKINLFIDYENLNHNSKILVPPLSVQPLIENAIKHGFDFGKSEGAILILFEKSENSFKIIVADNGIGVDNEKEKGMAIDIIQKRIENINIFSKIQYRYYVEIDQEERLGYCSILEINY